MDFDFSISMPPMLNLKDQHMKAQASFKGKLKNDYLQLLPKFALQYEWQKGNSVYATVSRGYRSGGYNVQMFSDLVQSELKNSMKTAMMESDVFKKYAGMIGQMMPEEKIDVKASTTYKPEYSWNYEAGAHLTLWEGRLWADLCRLLYGYARPADSAVCRKRTGTHHHQCRQEPKLWRRSRPAQQPDRCAQPER